ncbi:MAG TPA: hypothetical protein VGL57_13615 [Solirubrobacteraceae bacterium]|jgi:cytoskeletal protein RodZ
MHPLPGSRRVLSLALISALITLSLPTAALAAGAQRSASPSTPTFPVPASARVHGTTPSTTAPAAGATTSTAPAPATTPAGTATTPAGVAGTGAASSSTPAATAPATPAAPATTAPVSPAGTAAALPPAGTRQSKPTTKRLSTGAIVAAALAALLILLCLVWGAARWWAYEPRWSVSLRHSLAEASWRLSASWDEFSDWARLGR